MTSKQQQPDALPEPMALTPEQLTAMAAATAGGLSLIPGVIIRCGAATRRSRLSPHPAL